MAEKVRINLELNKELSDYISDLGAREGVTRTEIIRRGLSVIKAFDKQRAEGNNHIGFASSSDAFDTEMVGVLDSN